MRFRGDPAVGEVVGEADEVVAALHEVEVGGRRRQADRLR
jgi:hypothetical protein